MAGLNADGSPYICAMDLIGAPVVTTDFVVAGTSSENLYGMCEGLFRPDLPPEAPEDPDEDDLWDGDADPEDEPEDPEAALVNAWGGISRAERYRARAAARDGSDGGEEAGPDPDNEDNPVPHLIDPITLEPARRPAISPAGHVMGLATWKAVLAGPEPRCPFTKAPLSWEQVTVLTHANIDRFRDRIK